MSNTELRLRVKELYESGVTMRKIAKQANMQAQNLNRWLNRNVDVRHATLVKIFNAIEAIKASIKRI